MNIKEGDTVLIISGDDKGRKGKVLRVLPQTGKIFVEKINIQKKHQRPKKEGEKGQMISKEGALGISKAMLICPKCNQPTRVGFIKSKIDKEKLRKSRVCKKCQAVIK